MSVLNVVLYSFGAGVIGTALGAVFMMIFNIKSDKFVGLTTGFAGGFMIAIVCFDLIPEGIENSNILITVLAVIIGIALVLCLDKFFEKPINRLTAKDGKYAKMGAILIIAISLHNLPEGMAIGSLEHTDSALVMALLIAIHNIPEGIAMAMPLLRSGVSKLKTLILVTLSGTPTVLGSIIGYYIGSISPWFVGVCLSLAGGAMLIVIFEDMAAESYKLCDNKELSIMWIFGILLGLLLINLI